MILKACRLAIRKYSWLPLVGAAQAVITFVARHGTGDVGGIVEAASISAACGAFLLAVLLVPLEYHRLKREAAGFTITPR